MKHSPRFEKLVSDGRQDVREISVVDVMRAHNSEAPVLLDVREDHEWHAGHIVGALHLGRGILERDIEKLFPDVNTPIILYCGGGYRSVLAAISLQKMGYTHVVSMSGGYRAWLDSHGKVTKPDQ